MAPSMGYGMPPPNHYQTNNSQNPAAAAFTMFNPGAAVARSGSVGSSGGASMAAVPAPAAVVPQSSWQGYGAPSAQPDPSNHNGGGWTNHAPSVPTPSAYNNSGHGYNPNHQQQQQQQMCYPPAPSSGGGGIMTSAPTSGGIMASAPTSGEHVASIFSSASPTHHAVKHIETTMTTTTMTTPSNGTIPSHVPVTTPDALPLQPPQIMSSPTTKDPRMSLNDSVPTTPAAAATATATVNVDPTPFEEEEEMDLADVPLDTPGSSSPAMVDISLTSPAPTAMPHTTTTTSTASFSDAANLFGGGLGMPPPPFSRRSAS
eukprot:scaffold54034_cov30-Attheya_sp.AAC.1